MGYHFVPQAHLRRFECPDRPGFVWMYDRTTKKFSCVSIKSAAQSRKYYDDHVETGLAKHIETPANIALDKLRRQEPLNDKQRFEISLYLLTMATRGPRFRNKLLSETAPKALKSVIEQNHTMLQEWLERTDHPMAYVRLKQLKEIEAKYEQDHPQNIIDISRTPFASAQTLHFVHNMIWRLIPAHSDHFFVTSDTPTHISEWAGVGTHESELTFPISRDQALIGSHTGPPASVQYRPFDPDLVDEGNRRMIDCSDRFIFSHIKADWIAEWANTPPPINRIRWGY